MSVCMKGEVFDVWTEKKREDRKRFVTTAVGNMAKQYGDLNVAF